MPFEPLRFMHAADLSLDRPLEGTGPLPDDVRRVAEDATLTAFGTLVTACLEQKVDFLLLAGNSFCEQDGSVRARVALGEGFHRLAEQEIRVFVMPGGDDPPTAWYGLGDLPDNVTVFYGQTGEAVAVIRDGRVIASVSAGLSAAVGSSYRPPSPGLHAGPVRRTPFTIGLLTLDEGAGQIPFVSQRSDADDEGGDDTEAADVRLSPQGKLLLELSHCPVDYVALGGGDPRKAVPLSAGVAHNPGRTQGRRPAETGPHGCTLVDVNAHGTLESRFIPTAAVRWERFETTLDAATSRDELAHRMRTALSDCRPEPCERAFLVRWIVRGDGPCFRSLAQADVQRQLLEHCRPQAWIDRGLLIHHAFQLVPTGEASGAEGPLLGEFGRLLDDQLPLTREQIGCFLHRAKLPEPHWARQLESLTTQIDSEAVASHARRLAAGWLATGGEEDRTS